MTFRKFAKFSKAHSGMWEKAVNNSEAQDSEARFSSNRIEDQFLDGILFETLPVEKLLGFSQSALSFRPHGRLAELLYTSG